MKKRIRLYNFLIDSAVFFVAVTLFSVLLNEHVAQEDLKYVITSSYCLYYFIMEWSIGQTIGKMITKTKVVTSHTHEKPKALSILVRSLCRLIPFDFFTYLFIPKGIHDRLSKTELKQL